MAQAEEESMGKKRKRPNFHAIGQTIVTVKNPFQSIKSSFAFTHPSFRGALSGSFEEARDNIVVLSDDSVDTFRSFYGWLYTQQLQPSNEQELTSSKLVKLYVLADKIGATMLKNQIIDSINLIHSRPEAKLPSGETIDYLFEHTPANSPIQRLLIDRFAFNINPKIIDVACLSDRPVGFTAGIAMVNLRRMPRRLRNEKAPFEIDLSQYHQKDELTQGEHPTLDNTETNKCAA
ncbi:MAG: hypothetical protein M1835_003841 [Candelina submexicana]|nr:MAG: hypothetical protein M1835_003841 [Candelina submexicana]